MHYQKKAKAPPISEQAQEVKEFLLAGIFRNEFPEGTRLVEQDLKELTGTTHRAVRQALSELANEGILERRRRLGTFVSSKAKNRSDALPISKVAVLTSLSAKGFEADTFLKQVMVGIRETLAAPHSVVRYNNGESPYPTIDSLPAVKPEQLLGAVQGLIAIEANHAPTLNDLALAGVPVVAVDFCTPRSVHDVVLLDHQEAGYLATSHLLAQGHRQIGFIGERPNHQSTDPTWQARLAGYLYAMAEVTAPRPEQWILDVRRNEHLIRDRLPDFHREHALTAYVLCTGGMRDTMLETLSSMKLECPRDVSLASADGSRRSFKDGHLSHVQADYAEFGRVAVRILASRLKCRTLPPIRVMLPVSFSPGDSSIKFSNP